MKPWEKYSQVAEPQPTAAAKPWERYQAQPQGDGYSAANPMPGATEIRPPISMPDGQDDIEWWAQGDEYNAQMEKDAAEAKKRDAMIGLQAAGRGVADLIGSPSDLIALGVNTIRGGASHIAEKFGSDYNPELVQGQFMGSDFIADTFANMSESLGMPITDPDTLHGSDKFKYNALRFGTSAGVGGAGLASRAKATQQPVEQALATTANQKRNLPQIAQDTMASAGKTMTAPYQDRPIRQIIDDTVMGVGAGTGATVAEEYMPDSTIAALAAPIIGGSITSPGSRTIEAATKAPFKAVSDNMDVKLPDGTKEKRQTVNDAARVMQGVATDPQKARENINNMNQVADGGKLTRLTTGMAADDVGLGSLEVDLRNKDRVPYMERDQQIKTDAAKTVSSLRDPEADVTAPQKVAQNEAARQTGLAQQKIDKASQTLTEAEKQRVQIDRDIDETVAPIRAQRGRESEASKALDSQIGPDGALGERTKLKNDKFAEAADGQQGEVSYIAESIKKIEGNVNSLGFENTGLPKGFVNKVKDLMPSDDADGTGVLDAAGNEIMKDGPDGTVDMKSVSEIRGQISSAIGRARAKGEFELADNLGELKSDINRMIDDHASFEDAQKYYREEYAPFFAEGYGRQYRDTVQRSADRTGSADPSNVASIFLNGTPDAAADLKRIVDIAPDNKAASAAVEKYMAADLAARLGEKPSPRAIARWVQDRSDQLDQFPEIKAKFENLHKKLGEKEIEGDSLNADIKRFAQELKGAEADSRATEQRINKGVLGVLIGQDPDKYVSTILGGKDRLQKIDEVNKLIGSDKQAQAGFKRAVTEHLIKTVTGVDSKAVDEGDGPVLFNKIAKVIRDDREALSKIYTPKEMNAIERMHKMLSQYSNLNRRSTSGSDTAHKQSADAVFNALEAGLKFKYGVLKGGGILRTIKVATKLFPSRANASEQLVARAMLDPDVAIHLLDTPVEQIGSVSWNGKLNTLLGVANMSRESSNDESNTENED